MRKLLKNRTVSLYTHKPAQIAGLITEIETLNFSQSISNASADIVMTILESVPR